MVGCVWPQRGSFFLSLYRLKSLARGYDAITRVYAVIYAVWIRGAGDGLPMVSRVSSRGEIVIGSSGGGALACGTECNGFK